MNYTEALTRYVANFVDELAASGLTDVIISPGSRSTPLAILFREHETIRDWVVIDERSAAFFALGIAKETKRPAAIVCTSGTAAANYYPAIIEAHYARVPLLVLTADRPHELREVGASQAMNQLNLYGTFVKHFEEMAPPDASDKMIRYVRSRAAKAFRLASETNPGPVHLNFPFQEPLVPDLQLTNLWSQTTKTGYNVTYEGKKQLTDDQLALFLEKIEGKEKGIVVCGPQVDVELGGKITKIAEKLRVPIFADPLSQVRAGTFSKQTVISTYDTILRSKKLRKQLAPDYIIRFGAMPISKSYLFYLEEHKDAYQAVVEAGHAVREPMNHRTEILLSDYGALLDALDSRLSGVQRASTWLAQWQKLHEEAVNELTCEEIALTEGIAVQTAIETSLSQSIIFVGNSMPIRDVDTFFFTTEKDIYVHANRGVSGIDGTVSTAVGVAAATNKRVTLIIGDLSFYHDLNGLLTAKQYAIDLTILLINNNGGGIFSFLPQAKEEKHFEALFGTPHAIEFSHAAAMYQASYEVVTDKNELKHSLLKSYERNGLSIIEVQTNRAENVRWHRALIERVTRRLEELE